MQIGHQMKAFSETLQNGTNQISRVNAAQNSQHHIEAIDHILVRQDNNAHDIEKDAQDGNDAPSHTFSPKIEGFVPLPVIRFDIWTL